jgi:hypothetical protein
LAAIETGTVMVDGVSTFFRRVHGDGSSGGRDRYIRARFGAEYAARLPNSQLIELPQAGHWPWIDPPELVDRVIRFLATDEGFGNP